MTDPVCHVPPDSSAAQPGPQNLPGIPPPTASIASLLATVTALRHTMLIITGRQGVQGPRGQSGPRGQDVTAKGQWQEDKAARIVETVKIFSKSDPTNFVEVEQVNGITMKNKDTGQTWNWRR